MQRSKTSSTSSTSASTALRRTLRSERERDLSDEDDLADPRPWETRAPLKLYGSSPDAHPTHPALNDPAEGADLPLYDDMEARKRYGGKEANQMADVEEKTELLDDQGKWAKGHGAGPGVGGRRGLPPRQRVGGWVSSCL